MTTPTVCSRVFFDVTIDDLEAGRIEVDLFCETPKTSENFRALCTGEKGISTKSKKALHFKDTISTELFQDLWPKEAISQISTGQVENRFMVKDLRMKISNASIPAQVYSLWPMQVLVQTDHNFSCVLLNSHILIKNMLFLDKFPRDMKH